MIGKSIGNYQIKAKLGEGGMGAVYLGEHPLIGKRVAIKVLLQDLANKQDMVARFFTEAKAVNDIGHPNIVDIVDFGSQKTETGGDFFYLIMEFLNGESLAARLKRGRLSIVETTHVMSQCCSALAASHGKGIIHRDLKPDNIYLCKRPEDPNFVKLLDFGIAKLTGNTNQPASYKTRTGSIFGTPHYMSPEQCDGTSRIDHRSDIYAMGVVMYQLLTGQLPFPGTGFGEIIVGHMTRPPEKPSAINSEIPEEIEAIVLHALEKPRERRFQSMEEFGAALADPRKHFDEYRNLPLSSTMASKPAETAAAGGTRILTATAVPIEVRAARERSGVPVPTRRTEHEEGAPKPTTLSGAASELLPAIPGSQHESRRSRVPLIAALAGGIALAVGLIFVLKPPLATVRPQKGHVEPPADPTPPADPHTVAPVVHPEDLVTVDIASEPSGAQVLGHDGAELGTTPFPLKLPRGPAYDVRLKLEGYQIESRTVETAANGSMLVHLRKAVPAPEKSTAARAVPGRPHPHGGRPPEVSRPAKTTKTNKKKDSDDILTPSF